LQSNFGAADIVEFFGDPEAGFSFMGFRITGESMRRKTDQIDFSTVDTSSLDPSVQNALRESVPLIQQGLKIREILTDPTMVQKHPWLTKRDDIRFTQIFRNFQEWGAFIRETKLNLKKVNLEKVKLNLDHLITIPSIIINNKELIFLS